MENKQSLKFFLKIIIFILILVEFFLIAHLYYNSAVYFEKETINVKRIVDGDTIESTNRGKIRLLGINAPEKNMYLHNEAKNFLKQLENKKVEIEIRPDEKYDKYERILAYINYNNKLINEELLRQGLAHYYTYSEDRYTKTLLKAEKYARAKQIGIWEKSQDKCADANCIILFELNEIDPGEYIILKNKCEFSCDLNDWTIKDDATHIKKLNFSLRINEEIKIKYKGRIWNDAGDSFYLRDAEGKLVLFYRY